MPNTQRTQYLTHPNFQKNNKNTKMFTKRVAVARKSTSPGSKSIIFVVPELMVAPVLVKTRVFDKFLKLFFLFTMFGVTRWDHFLKASKVRLRRRDGGCCS